MEREREREREKRVREKEREREGWREIMYKIVKKREREE